MKKIMSCVLTAAFVLNMLAGCGSKTTSAPAASGSAAAGTAAAAAEKSSLSEKGVYPISDKTLDITIFMPQVSSSVTDYYNNKFTKYLEETANVKLKFVFAPEKEAAQKLSLLLASNKDLPDVIMGQDLKIDIVTYANQGIFIPLNQYIENDSVYFKKALDENPQVKQLLSTPDGNIYSMPLINLSFPNSVNKRMWINKTWLDKLGLKMPTTTEEFKAVLKAFKEKDPNGNGKADEIPLMGATTGWATDVEGFLMNSFIQYNNLMPYDMENGKVTPIYDREEYRNGLRYLNSLVKEGLLDPTSFTQDLTQLKQLFENEGTALLGALPSGGPNSFANMKGTRYHDYTVVPPLKGPAGVQLSYYDPYSVATYDCIITSAAKDPRAVFKFLDLFYSEDATMRSRFGEPEVDWKKAEPGQKNLTGGQARFVPILPWGPPQNVHWQNKNPGYQFFTGQELRSDDPYELQRFLAEAAEQYRPFLPKADTIMTYRTLYSLEDTATLAGINTTLNDFIQDQRVKFITGALDIDRDWDKYLAELDKIGYKKVVEIMQKRSDENK
jgi:putative aldouronate transport system substrate-binding protein